MNTYFVTKDCPDGREGFEIEADSVDIHPSGAVVFYRKASLYASYSKGTNWGFKLEEEGKIETL